MAGPDFSWLPLATNFPAGLDTQTDPVALQDGFSPDAYGMDIDYPGRLVSGSIPTGTAQVAKTYTIGSNVWSEYFDRMWRINTTPTPDTLLYLATGYLGTTAAYEQMVQGRGAVEFADDAQNILTFLPAGNNMFVAKSTGGYMIFNANTDGDIKRRSDIEEAMKISNKANCNVLDSLAFASNGNGLMAWDGNRVVEVTANVRRNKDNSLFSYFQNQALLIDPQKRRVIGTGSFVYDMGMKKLFQWGASGFRFTSRVLTDNRSRKGLRRPFIADSIAFHIENTTQAVGTIKFQVRRGRNTWEDEEEIPVRWENDSFTRVEKSLENDFISRQFQIRVTSLPSHVHVHAIDVRANIGTSVEESSGQ